MSERADNLRIAALLSPERRGRYAQDPNLCAEAVAVYPGKKRPEG